MAPKILLLGCNGQLGWELQRSLSVLGELVALGSRGEHNPGGLCGDLTDLSGLTQTLNQIQPDVVVNAAAYTAVDRAESESERAHAINAGALALLAETTARANAWLVHYSTDYVFDGSGTQPWRESDACAPLSVYGRTKLEGERWAATNPRHLIFRTSWVYAARGGNFIRTMLRLGAERDTLRVIDDQIGAPTSAELLADVSAQTLAQAWRAPQKAGLYHCCASGETSWHGYARFVLEQARALGWALKASPEQVLSTSTANYPTAAQRPLNSRLNTEKLRHAFELTLPPWQQGVARMLQEISPPPTP